MSKYITPVINKFFFESKIIYIFLFLLIATQGCVSQKKERFKKRTQRYSAKQSSNIWYKSHWRINGFKRDYKNNANVMKHWEKASVYLPYIRRVFKKYNLPNELCLLPMIESSFNPKAANSRAAGLWQFVAPTAKEYGLKISFWGDDRYDWKKSTVAAAKYLSWLGKQCKGDWALALASYNMGPGAIKRAMKKQNCNNYWDLKIRKETMDYVPRFLALIQMIRSRTKAS